MTYREIQSLVLAVLSVSSFQAGLFGGNPQPPSINEVRVTNAQKRIQWTPYPGALEFKILRSGNLVGPYTEDSSGSVSGYEWMSPLGGSNEFYRLQVIPLEPNALLTSIVLNRLAYGPTPDELQRVMTSTSGPDGYIKEQLAPELIQENLSVDNSQIEWVYVTISGKGSGTNFYIYPDSVCDFFIDDIKLVAGTVAEAGPSLLGNGDFEAPLSGPWNVSTNLSGSAISSDQKHTGNGSLHLISTKSGSSLLSIWQSTITPLNRSQTYTLSYWYLPSANGNNLTIRLSSNGILSTHSIRPAPYVNLATGTATIDDLRAWHVLHAVQSQRQLLEVMTQFVDNHFTTYYSKTQGLYGQPNDE